MSYAGIAETPAAPVVEVSSWGRRFGAWLIDTLVLAIPTGILFGVWMFSSMSNAGLLDPSGAQPSDAALEAYMNEMMGRIMLLSLVSTIISVLYFVLMHGTTGKTLGKMAVGIKVIKDDGTRCDFGAAFKRAVIYPIAGGVPYVGFIVTLLNGLWPLWDERHQSLGDKLAATYVVRSHPPAQPLPPAVV